MVKKKNKKEDEVFEEENQEDNFENEEFDYTNDSAEPELDDTPVNPLGLAHQISKESKTMQHFKELPREVKYSFLDKDEKTDVKHFSRTYRNHQYIEKIIDLRMEEDITLKESRKKILDIKTKEDLIEYFKNCGRDYLINDISDLSQADTEKIIKHCGILKHNYFLDTIENKKEAIKILYDDWKEVTQTPDYIDDMGNIGKIVDTSVASMGFKGNASTHSVMTIQAVKNEDIQKVAEEKRSFGFIDAIKKKLG